MKNVDFVCPKCGRRIKFSYNVEEEHISTIICYCGKGFKHSNDSQGKVVMCYEDRVL